MAATLTLEAFDKINRLGVVQLECLVAQRLQSANGRPRLQLLFFFGGNLVLGGHPDDIATLSHAQSLGLQDDIQRLIPGNVLQTQSQAPSDAVGSDDIEAGEIGNHLQQRPDFHILEIQRQFFSPVARALRQFVRVRAHGMQLDHQLIVTLVGGVLPLPACGNHQPDLVSRLCGSNALHGRAEIRHVKTLAQRRWQR